MKTVIFDIGNVLIDFDAERMIRQMSRVCGISEQETLSLYKHVGVAYERGELTSAEFFEKFNLRKNVPEELFWKAFTDVFRTKEGIEELMRELKKRQLPIFLLSNTCEAHMNFLKDTFPLFQLADRQILSFEVGARKPEPQIFERAVLAAGVPPEECFYTDDIVSYVEAARSLGIRAEPFTTVQNLRRSLKI